MNRSNSYLNLNKDSSIDVKKFRIIIKMSDSVKGIILVCGLVTKSMLVSNKR